MNDKKLAVEAYLLNERRHEASEKLMSVIATSFEALTSLSPDNALNCLNQLKDQITPEFVKGIKEGEDAFRKKAMGGD